MAAIAAEGLLCRICFNYLDDPKLLPCGHTFCKKCLVKLQCVEERVKKRETNCESDSKDSFYPEGSLTCPMPECSRVFDGKISAISINRNFQGMVDDFKSMTIMCTKCERKSNSPATSYCAKCNVFVCKSHHNTHNDWWQEDEHELIDVNKIKEGEVVIRQNCKYHGESLDYICTKCNKAICIKCRFLDCEKNETKRHDVMDENKYMTDVKKKIKTLEQKSDDKQLSISKHLNLLNEQIEKVKSAISACKKDVEKAYDEAVAKLREGKNALLKICDNHQSALLKKLSELAKNDNKLVSRLNDARELIGYGIKALGTGHMIETHDALCDRMKDLLDTRDPDLSEATLITKRGEKLQFNKKEVELGDVKVVEWKLKADVELSKKDSMNGMAPTADDRIAIGSRFGGIEKYSTDGKLQQTVLKEVNIREIAFLTDGRCAVRNCDNKLELYTSEWKKIYVSFETLSYDEGGFSCLCTDRDDHIYVGYRKANKIQVFTPSGGKAVREISNCGGYEIEQTSLMEHGNMLVVKTHRNAVRLCNQQGKEVESVIIEFDNTLYSAVCKNHTILIADINKEGDRVSIEQYTSELKYMRTLVTDHVIQKTERGWYYLREFTSGHLAFCTPDRLYIFQKIVSPPEG